ncbi:MAG: DUF1822 family protein [Heteroscytonema crispum UTEX LB 1556]
MRKHTDSVTFTVPISLEARSAAENFRKNHHNPQKRQQVYFNTLAVYAVKFYLRCMGFKTDLEASLSWNSVMQVMMDVADLHVVGLGKLECRPVLLNQKLVCVPPEVWSDRIGYVIVKFNESFREATLLGFVKNVSETHGEVALNQLRSLEDFIVDISEVRKIVKRPVHLSQWLRNVVDFGWQNLDVLLSQQQTQVAFRFRSTEETLADNPNNPKNSNFWVQKGTLLDLGGVSSSQLVTLVVGLTPASGQEINICVKVYPISGQMYLPENLELMVLDDLDTAVMQATARSTKSIQLNFSSEVGECFSIKVILGDTNFTEIFLV